MVLKEYFNFEKNISNKLLSITTIEKQPNDESFELDYSFFDSFYIVLNVGSILQIELDGVGTFLPAKDCLLGFGKRPVFTFNKNNYYKMIVFNLKPDYCEEIFKKIVNAVDYPFNEIFKSRSYCFSFSLNIEVIELIENMYKYCGDTNNANSQFQYLEMESSFIFLLSNILKIVLFEEHKFNAITATVDSKFYMTLRKIINYGEKLDDLLGKYKLDKAKFIEIYRKHFPKNEYISDKE